jgi:hypothetical protein
LVIFLIGRFCPAHIRFEENPMSYRALVSIVEICMNAGPVRQTDFRMTLDEDFELGEQIAEKIASKRTLDAALTEASMTLELLVTRFEDDTNRREWISDYADQTWAISFETRGDYTRVVISGRDAGGEEIFKRVTVYG